MTKGAVYQFSGWAFPEMASFATAAGNATAARVVRISGAVMAVRGSDQKPETELGGMPLGTVGSFLITSVGAI